MGIPKYHKWLTERYPDAFGEARDEEADHVYVDVNALLHDVMRHSSTEEEFFQRLFSKFDKLFHIVRPLRSIFLAVDGPASCAKCLTQRQRRRDHAHKDAKQSKQSKGKGKGKKGGGKGGGPQLSNNMLTPGVPFMAKLTSALEYYVASRMSPSRALASCEWATVSGAHAVGEGEHKIVSQLLRNAAAGGASESHVISSGDADIFLLSLVQNACRKVRVVSEPQNHSGDKRKRGPVLQIWNAEVLASSICEEKSGGGSTHSLRCADESAVRRDFSLISLLAGNDYLPELKCGRSAQQIWDQYLDLRRSKFPSESLLQTSPTGDLPLSHSEGGWALEVREAGAAFVAEPYEHFAFHQAFLAELMQRCPGGGGGQIGSELAAEAAEGVQKYLEGLLWIMEMYHHGYCGDFYFVMEKRFHRHASACNIVALMADLEASGAEPLAPSRSQQPPMRPLSCALCILPVQHAEQFLCPGAPLVRPMFASDHPLLGGVNAIEKSEELVACKAKVTSLQQQMLSLRAQGMDDSQAKAALTDESQRLAELKQGGGGDIDTVSLSDVDAEVVQRLSGRPCPTLDFAPDVTLLRDAGADAFPLEAPTRGLPRMQCKGLAYISGEYPASEHGGAASGLEAPWGGDELADEAPQPAVAEDLEYEEDEGEFCEAEDEAFEIEAGPLAAGDAVEGYWPDDDTWLPASLTEVHADGSMTIAWAEDASQSVVPADYVRRRAADPAAEAGGPPAAKRLRGGAA